MAKHFVCYTPGYAYPLFKTHKVTPDSLSNISIIDLSTRLLQSAGNITTFFYLCSCIFILLSRESDQSTIRARLGVTSHLSTTPRWGNSAKCLSQRHNK